eukprot:TRINITY_DN4932_c0_g1_i1.p1 TRINITY_DN4932_c0_g1~~TRINITY_DN4932_c0_g1_i1.p1  ORF type:complete len:185 (+),score=46.02 TRINITY_DN4932_c0_g1_i1:274-828(+)
MQNADTGMLHRAFSVFIFHEGKLLLQQRADAKITFPGYWSNSCCSHPLYIDEERETRDQIGIKRAAIRKMHQELGVPPDTININDFTYITRIYYQAPYDDLWGEHEVDYILFLFQDVELNINPNEVKDYNWVTKQELQQILESGEILVTPWLRMLCNKFLNQWWDGLDDLDQFKDNNIHTMVEE